MVWITLLKGINVGGHNIVKMDRLKSVLERKGLAPVKTYIQSGNVISAGPDAQTVGAVIQDALRHEFSVTCDCVTLSGEDITRAVEFDAFPGAEAKQVHLYFPCVPDSFVNVDHLQSVATKAEQVIWQNRVLYLHTPNGFGTSNLAAKLPRLLSNPFTGRNLNTATKLADMAGAMMLGDL